MKKLLPALFLIIATIGMAKTKPSPESKKIEGYGFIKNYGQIIDQNDKINTSVRYMLALPGINIALKNGGFCYDTYKTEVIKERNSKERMGKIPEAGTSLFKFHRLDIEFVDPNKTAYFTTEEQANDKINYISLSENGVVASHFGKIVYHNVYNNIDVEFVARPGTEKPIEYNFILHPGANINDIKLRYKGANFADLQNNELVFSLAHGHLVESIPASYWKENKKPVHITYKLIDRSKQQITIGFTGNIGSIKKPLIIDPNPNLDWGTYYGGVGTNIGYGLDVDAAGNVIMSGYTTASSNISTVGSHQVTMAGTDDGFLAKFNSSGVRQWATYYGGTGSTSETLRDVITDASNNIFVVGYTRSTTGIATAGAYQTALYSGWDDAFLVKFNASGVRQWGTYFGGNDVDYASAVATDATGNVYICGSTSSTVGLASAGAHQTTYGGSNSDGFIAKFNNSGTFQWATYYGGSLYDYSDEIAIDPITNFPVIIGHSSSSNSISTAGAHQTANGGGLYDAFVVKLNTSGVRQWATYYGGTLTDYGEAISIDASGNIFFGGYTKSTAGISTPGSHQPTINGSGNFDAYLAKLNSAGVRQWGTYYGGINDEMIYSVANEGTNVVFCGEANTGGQATFGAWQTIAPAGANSLIGNFNTSGVPQWVTYYAGAGTDKAWKIASNGGGIVYVTGETTSTTSIASAGAYQTAIGGSPSAFLARFSTCTLPAQPGAISGSTTICNSSTTSFSIAPVPGATSYSWTFPIGFTGSSSTNSISVTAGSSGGTMSVTAINACGSSPVQSQPITVVSLPPVAISTPTDEICMGGSFTLTGTGASTYSWSTGATTSSIVISPTVSQGYSVVGTNSGGCSNNDFINLTVYSLPTVNISGGSTPQCAGMPVSLTASLTSGTGTYLWSTSATTSVIVVTPTITTTYTVVGTRSSTGCQNSAVVTVTVNPSPTVTVNSASICSGNSANLTANGASSYSWSTGATSSSVAVSPTTTTTYTVYGTTASCTGTNTAIVTVNTTPTITAANGVICPGNSFTITPSGAATYTFSSGSAVVNPTVTTNYTVNGTSAQGCSGIPAIVTVSVSPSLSVNISGNSAVCIGNSIVLTASGASTYSWNTGATTNTISISPTVTTNYSVIGSSGSCSNTSSVSITANPMPTVSVNSSTICSGNSTNLTASGASTYSWSTGSTSVSVAVSPTTTTTYTVYGTSAGCTGTNTSVVTVNITPTITAASGVICPSNSYTIVPSGAFTYTFSSGSAIVSPTATTNYTVTGSSAAGCLGNQVVVTVTVSPSLSVTISGNNSVCTGSSIVLTANGASTYSWSTGATTNTISISPTLTSNYSVLGSSGSCSNSNSVTITVNPLPSVNAVTSSSLICSGQTATLSSSGANTYTWNTGANGSSLAITPGITTSYTVTGTDMNGCVNYATIVQNVSACTGIAQYTGTDPVLLYPNPNNGHFIIELNGNAQIVIFNLLGEIIFNGSLSASKNQIDLNEQGKGIYFVKISIDGKNKVFKTIIE